MLQCPLSCRYNCRWLRHCRNIIDIGLIGPDGRQRGASGSDKASFSISETEATPGYRACALVPGEWRVLIGAYRVQPKGVDVTYTIRFEFKKRRPFYL